MTRIGAEERDNHKPEGGHTAPGSRSRRGAMKRRDEDGRLRCASGTVAQTMAALEGAQATVEHLWQALFSGLATEAGLPLPAVSGNIASYHEAAHADGLAEHMERVLGGSVQRFDMKEETYGGRGRHLVSVG